MARRFGYPDELERRERYTQSLVDSPVEAPEVEYKGAAPFKPREDFTYDLVRHILGMSNYGGGHIVIGFTRDTAGALVPDPEMTDDISATYDATPLSQHVAKHVRGPRSPEVTVSPKSRDGKTFPVLSVAGFSKVPFFCRSTVEDSSGKNPLEQDALYVRDAKTRTVRLASADQWEDLIAKCVSDRQSEIIETFRIALEGATLGSLPASSQESYVEKFREIVKRERELAARHRKDNSIDYGTYSFWHAPLREIENRPPQELLENLHRAEQWHNDFPMGRVEYVDRARSADQGIRMQLTSCQDTLGEHWFMHRGGGFFFCRTYDEFPLQLGRNEMKNVILRDIRIRFIGEAIEHCLALHRALGCPLDTAIHFEIEHSDLASMFLGKQFAVGPFRGIDPLAQIQADEDVAAPPPIEITLGQLAASKGDVVYGIVRDLLANFSFTDLGRDAFQKVYTRFLESGSDRKPQ